MIRPASALVSCRVDIRNSRSLYILRIVHGLVRKSGKVKKKLDIEKFWESSGISSQIGEIESSLQVCSTCGQILTVNVPNKGENLQKKFYSITFCRFVQQTSSTELKKS